MKKQIITIMDNPWVFAALLISAAVGGAMIWIV